MAPFNIILADDDRDDRFFFNLALRNLPFPTRLMTVNDGEALMEYLLKNGDKLPEVLFLDLNMPKKNGVECLSEIKRNAMLKGLPVIIYSTSVQRDIVDLLYEMGAQFYVRKCELSELTGVLQQILLLIKERKDQPNRKNFILNSESDSATA